MYLRMRFRGVFVPIVILFTFVQLTFAQDATILEHGGVIQSVAFSPVDNTLVASAGGHNTIKLWNLQQNTVKELTRHKDRVHSVVFSPDGKLLASGSEDSTLKIWDVSQWENIGTNEPTTIQMPFPIDTVSFHPDGQLLATSGRHAKLVDITNQAEIATLEHDAWVWIIAFSPDGRYLATDDGAGTTVKVWDIQQKQITTILEGHTSDINFVKFSPTRPMLASSSADGNIKLWDVSNWESLGTLYTNGTVAIDFSPDGNTLASGGAEEIVLWSVTNGAKITTLRGHTGWIRGVAFSPDGTTLASGGEGGMLRVQNIESRLKPEHPSDTVRLIYFLPSDRPAQPDIDSKLEKLIKDVQEVFAEQLDYYGFGRKTFQFETDATGRAVVHHVKGKFNDEYYQTQVGKVWEEIGEYFDTSTNIYLAALDTSTEALNGFCGFGGSHGAYGGTVLIPASGWCFEETDVTIHELGHAFGLQHDFRNNVQPWIDLYSTEPMTTSPCAAEWLDAHRYFNSHHTYFDKPTTIEIGAPDTDRTDGRRLRFKITDPDGLHQAQLFATVEYLNGHDLSILDCKSLDGSSNIVEFPPTSLTLTADSVPLPVIDDSVTIRVIDAHGNFTHKEFTVTSREDVNMDGIVNIQDLVLVASNFGQQGLNRSDVNGDDVVNIVDLVLIAGAFGKGAAAPSVWSRDLEITPTSADVQQWLHEAQQVNLTNPTFQRGILMLEQLLVALTTPRETALLPNYPNPFNPETWIPYQLAESADVRISIYAIGGKLVRTLELGNQPMGIYASRSRAAYWDGKNQLGESVASGVYFYTLTVGDFTATRKMLIQK